MCSSARTVPANRTLINIIAGTYAADAGHLLYDGQELRHLTPHHARSIGISPVFQEFSLVPDLTVGQNLSLGREVSRFGFVNAETMHRRAEAVLHDLGFELDPRRPVRDLSRAQQQMVEIAKALLTKVNVLILDEPTASLTEKETQSLFGLVDRLRRDAVGIIYVSPPHAKSSSWPTASPCCVTAGGSARERLGTSAKANWWR